MSLSHTVARALPVPVERAFDVIVGEDVLPLVLHRVGPVPAVAGTRDLSGPWDTPGSTRTVVLDDGTTARETVLGWERPRRFEYRVEAFSSRLGRLVSHAVGAWDFAAAANGSRFDWTYTFVPRGPLARGVLWVFVHTAWARYMERCADRCVALAEARG